MKPTTVWQVIERFSDLDGDISRIDRRQSNGAPKILTLQQEHEVVSTETLQRQCHMTLRQRVLDLQARGINISFRTLNNYNKRHQIKFKTVDLIATNKILRANEIQLD